MSQYELPQDTYLQNGPIHPEMVALSFDTTIKDGEGDPIPQTERALETSTKDGRPALSLDAKTLAQMTPAETFALAGEMVKQVHEEQVAKQEVVAKEEMERVTHENREEAETIAKEIADEQAALIEKYGPQENWPDDARKADSLHKLGWGFAGIAGLSAFGGVTANEAQAMDLGNVIVNRTVQGIQIETNRVNSEEHTMLNHENKRNQIEFRIEQGRLRMEQGFQMQESQKNSAWEMEWNRQTTDAGRAQVKSKQDAEWANFVRTVQIQRQQFESNANLQRQQADLSFQGRIQHERLNARAQHRQADAHVAGQVIQDGVRGIFGGGFRRH